MRFLADNWWYILIIGVMAFIMFRMGGCCGGNSTHDSDNDFHGGGCCSGHTHHVKHNNHYILSEDTAKDHVCGMIVNKKDAITREINGQIYYFCSNGCANEFERNHGV